MTQNGIIQFQDFTPYNHDPILSSDPLSCLINIVKFVQAIMEVGEVIQFYDSDKQFPAWGFGGKLPGGTVSHCFNLNGSPGGAEVREYLSLFVQLFFL